MVSTRLRLFTAIAAGLVAIASMTQQVSSPGEGFKRLDRDGDGKLSQNELPTLNLLQQLGKNGYGFVTPAEAKALCERRQDGTVPRTPHDPGLKPRLHDQEATVGGLKPEVLSRLDLAMQQAIPHREVAGLIGLLHRNGARGYLEALGTQDIEAGRQMPKNAIIRLQRMTKPIIAVTGLVLCDEGKFALDEPMAKHCPEWAEPQAWENGELVPARNTITPRMLMSHRSGLHYGSIERRAFSRGGSRGTPDMTLETCSQELAKRPLMFHPGEGYQYGTSTDVLGRYIEALTGQPLDEAVRERVTGPLSMVDADFWVRQEKPGRVAQLYPQHAAVQLVRGCPIQQLLTKPTLFLGGQGLCFAAPDYERFCLMLVNHGELDGVRILKTGTVDLMFQNHLKTDSPKYGLVGALVDSEGGYALGRGQRHSVLDRPHEGTARYLHGSNRTARWADVQHLPHPRRRGCGSHGK